MYIEEPRQRDLLGHIILWDGSFNNFLFYPYKFRLFVKYKISFHYWERTSCTYGIGRRSGMSSLKFQSINVYEYPFPGQSLNPPMYMSALTPLLQTYIRNNRIQRLTEYRYLLIIQGKDLSIGFWFRFMVFYVGKIGGLVHRNLKRKYLIVRNFRSTYH